MCVHVLFTHASKKEPYVCFRMKEQCVSIKFTFKSTIQYLFYLKDNDICGDYHDLVCICWKRKGNIMVCTGCFYSQFSFIYVPFTKTNFYIGCQHKNELFFASHTLKKAMQWLEPWLSQMKYLLLRSWPWNFLCLNVIEIFWTFVKRKESVLQSTFLSDLKQKKTSDETKNYRWILQDLIRFNVSSQ